MSLFADILANLKHKIDAQNAYRYQIVQVLKEIIGITVDPTAITSLKDGVLTINVPPTIKMAINLKIDAIIQSLRAKQIPVSRIR